MISLSILYLEMGGNLSTMAYLYCRSLWSLRGESPHCDHYVLSNSRYQIVTDWRCRYWKNADVHGAERGNEIDFLQDKSWTCKIDYEREKTFSYLQYLEYMFSTVHYWAMSQNHNSCLKIFLYYFAFWIINNVNYFSKITNKKISTTYIFPQNINKSFSFFNLFIHKKKEI